MSRQFPSEVIAETIDADYPVAGQDNDSQGFRDNFSVIKDGLATAKAELTDLQTNTARLDDNNNFGGYLVDNATTNRLYGTVYTITDAGSISVDLVNGPYQEITVTGTATLIVTGWPTEDVYASMKLAIKSSTATAYPVTLSAAGGSNKVFISLSLDGIVSVNSNLQIIDVWTIDQGATVYFKLDASPTVSNISSLTDVTITSPANGQVLKYNGTAWVNGIDNVGDSLTLDNLTDVVITGTPTNGQVLKYDTATSKWVNETDATGDGGTSALDDLTDVAITGTPTIGQVLKFDGTSWVNSTDNIGDSLTIDNLTDVVITGTPTNGQVLKYDTATSKWVNGTDALGDSLTLDNLTDVVITNVQDNDMLKYDVATSQWKNDNGIETVTYLVTINEDGSGVQEVFFLDGTAIKTSAGVEKGLFFEIGKKYKFIQSDATNLNIRLKFSTTPDTAIPASVTNFSTEVSLVGTIDLSPGDVGYIQPYTEIYITDSTPATLFLWADELGLDTSLIGGAYPIAVGNKVTVTDNYTAIKNHTIFLDSTAGPFTVKLPVSSSVEIGDYIKIVDLGSASTNNITIDSNGSTLDAIVGNLFIDSNYTVASVVSDGTNWIIDNVEGLVDKEDLANASAVDLDKDVSYFSTAAAETATLAAGTEGQLKIFAMYADLGDMVITVTNPGWGGAGTITFSAAGQACTLQYINGKWFCIGNNGAAFA
jgi:hypothetical protein